ncbi:MAG: DUF302 domain-containing protein [Terracidiphilus sp.]|jgi:uncharacterized protein (DUF302 family)
MAIRQFAVDRFSIISSKPFADVLSSLEAAIGHPDMRDFGQKMAAAKSWQELEQVVRAVLGPSGFMEFTRFNLGLVIAKDKGSSAPKIVRLVVGNPLIMKQMAEHVPDTASYAPVTILIDERVDGVHLSYDLMVSYLTPYGNLAALRVARDLDAKVEALLRSAAE